MHKVVSGIYYTIKYNLKQNKNRFGLAKAVIPSITILGLMGFLPSPVLFSGT